MIFCKIFLYIMILKNMMFKRGLNCSVYCIIVILLCCAFCLQNIHHHDDWRFPECLHRPVDEDRKWLQPCQVSFKFCNNRHDFEFRVIEFAQFILFHFKLDIAVRLSLNCGDSAFTITATNNKTLVSTAQKPFYSYTF